jgi:hypothetical protein
MQLTPEPANKETEFKERAEVKTFQVGDKPTLFRIPRALGHHLGNLMPRHADCLTPLRPYPCR